LLDLLLTATGCGTVERGKAAGDIRRGCEG